MPHRFRVYLPEPAPDPDGVVRLPDDEAHHVRRVLRLRTGDALSLFDGRGREWSGALTRVGPDGVYARLGEALAGEVECGLEVSLFQGWCEPSRMEWVLQKGTELGLAAIHPVETRSRARRPSEQRLHRWSRIAVEAAKQCGRRRLPLVEPVDRAPDVPECDVLGLLLHRGVDAWPLAQRLEGVSAGRIWLAVGPAEGWEPAEVERMTAGGWLGAELGPRILRAETAGIAAATVVLHRLGDLGSSRG